MLGPLPIVARRVWTLVSQVALSSPLEPLRWLERLLLRAWDECARRNSVFAAIG